MPLPGGSDDQQIRSHFATAGDQSHKRYSNSNVALDGYVLNTSQPNDFLQPLLRTHNEIFNRKQTRLGRGKNTSVKRDRLHDGYQIDPRSK